MKILLDTDIGPCIDDAFALLYALKHPGIDLRGVIAVYGAVEDGARLSSSCPETTVSGQVLVPN